jgi:hypothetical protein
MQRRFQVGSEDQGREPFLRNYPLLIPRGKRTARSNYGTVTRRTLAQMGVLRTCRNSN